MELLKETIQTRLFSAKEVAALIANNTVDLFFDDFGSESSQPVEAFYHETKVELLNATTFQETLGLPVDDPQFKVARFISADEVLAYFADLHRPFELDKKAAFIVDLMMQNLTQIAVIILGEDYHEDVAPAHLVYVIGVGKEGSLAGFKSQVIWT